MDIIGQLNNTALEVINTPNGNNTIHSQGGFDIINGGIGYNVLYVNGNEADYLLTKNTNGYIDIDCLTGATQLTTAIKGVEAIQFNDKLLTLPATQTDYKTVAGETFIGYAPLSTVDYSHTSQNVPVEHPSNNYSVSKSGNLYLVLDKVGSGGQDILQAIQRIQFSDLNVSLDLDPLQSGGGTAEILGAIFGIFFGVPTLTGMDYAGIGIHYLDQGMSFANLMQLALNAKLGATFTNAQEIQLLYQNVLGVNATTSDVNTWSAQIQSGQYTQLSLAVMAAQSALNVSHINLTGLTQHGLPFLPFSG
jgi:hypothetical protein